MNLNAEPTRRSSEGMNLGPERPQIIALERITNNHPSPSGRGAGGEGNPNRPEKSQNQEKATHSFPYLYR